ncbi:MAG: PQQ-binding-like beta-propeller repeat protein [Polyangiaceae bacterium]|nr:PQQ-binding-like beta-propeller repeat protein [Polyangiaceae bacterium]
MPALLHAFRSPSRTLLALGLGISSLMFGCEAGRAGANPEAPLWKHHPSGALSVVFRKQLKAPSRAQGEAREHATPALDIEGRRIFVGSSDHGLYALSAVDGTTLWRFETAGPVKSTPLFDKSRNVVYFGSHDGALYAVDASTGSLRFRFMSNAEVQRPPILSGGRLFAVNANDTVMALDPNNGKLLWSQHRTPAMGMEVAGYSGALVHRGRVYVGFSDGVVMAYNAATGASSWEAVDLAAEAEQILGDIPQYFDVDTTPVAATTDAGPAIVVASYAAGVFALDEETGIQLWANTAPRGVTQLTLWHEAEHPPRGAHESALPIAEKTLLLASSGTSGLWALDPLTGAMLWQRELPNGAVSEPVAANGVLLVAGSELGLFAISPLDGSIIDGIHISGGIDAAPAAYGSRVFAMTNRGFLLGLHLQSPL